MNDDIDIENEPVFKDWNEAFGNGELTREKTNSFLSKHPIKIKCCGCGKVTNISKAEDWKDCECGSLSLELID
jgi:hypothetical protein